MAMDERRRMALYEALRRTLDEPNADTLMGLLPPQGWGDVASTEFVRGQVDQLRADMATQGAHLRTEMADLRTDTRTEACELRTEVRTGLAGLRTEIADLRAELHATMAANQRLVLFGLLGVVSANAGVVWAALRVAA